MSSTILHAFVSKALCSFGFLTYFCQSRFCGGRAPRIGCLIGDDAGLALHKARPLEALPLPSLFHLRHCPQDGTQQASLHPCRQEAWRQTSTTTAAPHSIQALAAPILSHAAPACKDAESGNESGKAERQPTRDVVASIHLFASLAMVAAAIAVPVWQGKIIFQIF